MKKNPYGVLAFVVFLLTGLLALKTPQEEVIKLYSIGFPTSIILGIIYSNKNKKENNLEPQKTSLSGIMGLLGITLSILMILGFIFVLWVFLVY